MPKRFADRDTTKVIVIGAGLGGLTSALALLQRGIDVDVYEQSRQLKEVGAGIEISSNGMRVLDALGLSNLLLREQVTLSRRELRHWRTGETWDSLDHTAASRDRHMMVHRRDVHRVLANAVRNLKPDAVRLGRKCIGVAQSEDQVEVQFNTGETTVADFVIGADGIHSKVRECLFGAAEPEFTGCVAWRGLFPMERLLPMCLAAVGINWLGPNGHVFHYAVSGGKLMNITAIVERHDWQLESWTEEGTAEELSDNFRGWHSDVHALIRNIDRPHKWALMKRAPLERWSERRITLLGDACHPTLPFLGQGAAIAMEDAYVVAACLAKYFDQPELALVRYERSRISRCTLIVRKSHEIRKQAFDPALSEETSIAVLARTWQQTRAKEQLDWLYGYDATAIDV